MPGDSLFEQAAACLKQGALDLAAPIYQAVLLSEPHHLGALHHLSLIRRFQRRFDEALDLLGRAVALCPRSLELRLDLAATLQAVDRADLAIAEYRRVIEEKPDHPVALLRLANLLQQQGRSEQAVACYQALLRQAPDHAAAQRDLGYALQAQGRAAQAVPCYRRALCLAPDDPIAWTNLGASLGAIGRREQAAAAQDRAFCLRSDMAEVLYNRAVALQALSRVGEARAAYAACLAVEPGHVDAAWNEAFCTLALGDFAHGWPLFERRWATPSQGLRQRSFDRPLWLGETPLDGRTILLHAEQGLGDTLLCVRFLHQVKQRGARIILEVQAPLLPLLADLQDPDMVVAHGQALPDFDLHCPLFSLPLALGTRLPDLAGEPYLRAPASARDRWARRLPPAGRRRVGVVWAGNPANGNDTNRSLPLGLLMPLLRKSECDFVVLQTPLRDGDADLLAGLANVVMPGEALTDFAETAAAVEQLDLVIAVDTAVAHLAGAMGKPLWLLLTFAPDWRWLLERCDSPWYPSAHLYRQSSPGDWTGVVDAVLAALEGPIFRGTDIF
jgi:tetratricopeptide (TPR) repeat protein